MRISILNQNLELSPERAIFWEEEKALILSDLHIGKGGHFRKAGIAVPEQLQMDDLLRLSDLVAQFSPEKMIVVGDMFHSRANDELEIFAGWRKHYPDLEVILVRGNHDILDKVFYRNNEIRLEQDGFQINTFSFAHEPPETVGEGFVFSGHLHPGVAVKGRGRQQFRLPCYWLSEGCVVLPAFAKFTGLYIVKPKEDERVIAIADGELVELG